MKRSLVALILLLMVLAACIGLLAYFTDGFDFSSGEKPVPDDPDDEPFVLELSVDGEKFTSESVLPKEVELRVDVNTKDFAVEILPYGNVTFDFRHNGTLVKFPYIEGNFNEAFEVEIGDGFFTLNAALRSMQKILEGFYPGEEISDITSLDGSSAYFVLRVTADEEVVEIPITGFYEILNITLDKTEIVF